MGWNHQLVFHCKCQVIQSLQEAATQVEDHQPRKSCASVAVSHPTLLTWVGYSWVSFQCDSISKVQHLPENTISSCSRIFVCRLDTRFETMGEFHQDLTPEISSVIGEHFYYFSGFEGASETCPNLLLKHGRICAYRPSNGNYFQCPNVQPDSDLPWLWGGFSTVSIISNPILQGLMKLSIGDGMWWPCMSLGICIRSDSPLRSAFEWQVRLVWVG